MTDIPVLIDIDAKTGVGRITLNRPQLHNAFDEAMIAQLTEAVRLLDRDEVVRVIVIAGNGKSFSAGGDLNWMRRMAGFTKAENEVDAGRLAAMFQAIDRAGKPTVVRAHGNVLAGGTGIVAAADIAIAAERTMFALTEVRLGLVPATISPYVLRAIGERQARRVFLTAERFDAAEAHRIGLVHLVVPEAELDAAIERVVNDLLAGGTSAQAKTKELVRAVVSLPIDAALIERTGAAIAEARASAEGREGLAAFFEKREPSWRRKRP
ncbi:MAG: enoyl-CoA hydratase/isomerase family protein [Alphaproteobacteria bacterium]|nr:enoyl-CoA hydratase/isomerase family protein [Alphaproteobacteria bacterium]